jgi:hypothetical protein
MGTNQTLVTFGGKPVREPGLTLLWRSGRFRDLDRAPHGRMNQLAERVGDIKPLLSHFPREE